jgi:adenylate kinase family enzyme
MMAVRRVSVVGPSGSGKTTVGQALAATLGIPFHELDAYWWREDWVPEDPDAFRTRIQELIAGSAWVIDGNYSSTVQDLIWGRADTVIWLDPPRLLALLQVIYRTSCRALLRRELWHGNRETWRNAFSRDSVVLWSWGQHPRHRRKYLAASLDPRWSQLRFVHVRTRGEVRRLLASTAARPSDGGAQ